MAEQEIATAADGALTELRALDKDARLLEHIAALVSWDQETYMPAGAADERAEQQALLQGLAHERNTAPRIGELLAKLGADPSADLPAFRDAPGDATDDRPADGASDLESEIARAFIREKHRQYRQATRVPPELVRALAEAGSRGQTAWAQARSDNDYASFKPWLSKLIKLNREMADALGHNGRRYDALLDQYEPYMRTADVSDVFGKLRSGLVDLVGQISECPQQDERFLQARFDVTRQAELSTRVMTALGYPADRGRLDASAHPFTTTLGSHDVRITTRYHESLLMSSLFSTIHETGHALYELGVAPETRGTLLAEGTSLGIHESQSRLWENMIGRSQAFWDYWFPTVQELFPGQLGAVDAQKFYRAANAVRPSLIRVEADEVTYSLHIILRFELEQRLIDGDLGVDDLPAAWNDMMEEYLGIRPTNDADGVLQDVHWSFGAFGYFPTYALGNLYAAQFLSAMEQEIPDLWGKVRAGQTEPLLAWLRTRIHRYGRARSASRLVHDITKGPLDHQPFLDYLQQKYGALYEL